MNHLIGRPHSLSCIASGLHRAHGILILLALAGCANPRCPEIPGGPYYCLQTSTAVAPFTVLQDIHISRGALNERLIAQLEVDASGMRLVGFTPLGQKVLSSGFDNVAATGESLIDERLDPRALLSLVQIATWPLEAVESGLQADWLVDDSPTSRRLLHDDRLVMEVLKQGKPPCFDRLDIAMPLVGFALTVEEVKDAP